MPEKVPKTQFAPAERAAAEELHKQVNLFKKNDIFLNVTNSVSSMIVVLNRQRQIIYANKVFLEYLELANQDSIIGKRPGEATDCLYAYSNDGGCGTSEFCRTCGSIKAIFEAQSGKQSVQECKIITRDRKALDLKVTATPYTTNGEMFTIFAVSDISDEKRRQTLERVFFHDVLNSAGGISGLSLMLQQTKNLTEIEEIAKMINQAASNLAEEIKAQRNLSEAERNDYTPTLSIVDSLEILRELSILYSRQEINRKKPVSVDAKSVDVIIETDIMLLRRVLGNMIKNAIEASEIGEEITLSCVSKNDQILFSVHNKSYIERNIQLQLFKRSFSTKGSDRGLGTYSMKLFGEKYLNGKVWFESTKENGTTFYLQIPVKPTTN